VKNRALVFIKPHAVTDKTISFVEEFLSQHRIQLSEARRITAKQIGKQGIVDKHYFAIARTAVFSKPEDYEMGAGAKSKFADAFGIGWDAALEKGKILNSVDAQERLGNISGIELNELWKQARQTKLAPGLYAGYFEEQDFYVINGFYPGQREVFTTAGAEVVLYEAEFDPAQVSWEQFRGQIIGATDPAKAVEGSLRNLLLERYTELGQTARPEMSRNGVHASAGPLEGLRERMVWLGTKVHKTPFAAALLERGMTRERLDELLENPVIQLDGQSGPVFDLTEDSDADAAVEKLSELIAD
jgi:nucleoside diphosphate kinase